MNRAASEWAARFNHFIVGWSAVNTRPRPDLAPAHGRSRDIAGENGRTPRPTLARESRHIVPLKLSGTTSRFAADRSLSSIE